METNGIICFDPEVVQEWYGHELQCGMDLFSRFTASNEGDEVLAAGIFVPILAIDDAEYSIIVRIDPEQTQIPKEQVVAHNGNYALQVKSTLVIADLESIKEWDGGAYGNRIQFPRGNYAVSMLGFSSVDLTSAGYELALCRHHALPKVTANTGKNMRILRQP